MEIRLTEIKEIRNLQMSQTKTTKIDNNIDDAHYFVTFNSKKKSFKRHENKLSFRHYTSV